MESRFPEFPAPRTIRILNISVEMRLIYAHNHGRRDVMQLSVLHFFLTLCSEGVPGSGFVFFFSFFIVPNSFDDTGPVSCVFAVLHLGLFVIFDFNNLFVDLNFNRALHFID
jgi:hypothetical protein